jgi:hypothetical protein
MTDIASLLHLFDASLFDALLHGLKTPVPDPDTNVNPPFVANIKRLLGWVLYGAMAAGVGAIIFTGIRMYSAYRDGGASVLAQFGWTLAGLIVATSAAGIVRAVI